MSADPGDPDGLTRWLARHGDPLQGDERDAYPRRALYGAYVRDLLARTLAAHSGQHVTHLRRRARDLVRHDGGFTVITDGEPVAADTVVLATGNPVPRLPAVLEPLAASPGCIVDPWRPGALAGIPAQARVLIVGTGLTMGDTVATLRAAGHRAPITAVSRRGQMPRRGLAIPPAPFGAFGTAPATARGLLRLARAEIRRAITAGGSWYGALAGARNEAWTLWAALAPIEQRRFARHVRHLYELHRHVMPGPIHDLIAAERASGGLRVMAAALREAEPVGSSFAITLQTRDAAAPLAHEVYDAVVNCTGPDYAMLTRTDPFWAALAGRGLVARDHAGLGPMAARPGYAVDAEGLAQPDLLLVGTLARSAFGELTGVREITLQARLAATAVACLDRVAARETV